MPPSPLALQFLWIPFISNMMVIILQRQALGFSTCRSSSPCDHGNQRETTVWETTQELILSVIGLPESSLLTDENRAASASNTILIMSYCQLFLYFRHKPVFLLLWVDSSSCKVGIGATVVALRSVAANWKYDTTRQQMFAGCLEALSESIQPC